MDHWYYAFEGNPVGPVSEAGLIQLLYNQTLPADILVWCTGMVDWMPANTVSELRLHPAAVIQPVLNYGVAPSVYQPADVGYAGFWIRLGAFIIDGILTNIAAVIVVGFVSGILQFSGDAAATKGLTGFLDVILPWLYFALMQSSRSQATVGMLAVGIRVSDLQGQPITFGRATGRYFASFISGGLLGVGFLMIVWTQRKQALHDYLAGTLVLRK